MASFSARFNQLDTVSKYMVYGIGSYFVAGYFYGAYHRSFPKQPHHAPQQPPTQAQSKTQPISVSVPAAAVAQVQGSVSGSEDLVSLLKDVQRRVIAIEKKL